MEHVIKWLSTSKLYSNWFAMTFEPKDFDGINRLFDCFIKYCSKLNIVPTLDFLKAYLAVDGKQDIKKYNIKIESMDAFDYTQSSQLEEAYQTISQTAISLYDQYMQEDLTDREFKVDIYDFIKRLKTDSIQKTFMDAFSDMNNGIDINDISDSVKTRINDINNTYDTESLRKIDYMTKDSEETEMEFIAKTGLPCIDGDVGGIYTHLMYTINSQPAGGKTRFSLVCFVYPVLMAGGDVMYFETELTAMQTKNILIAYHIIQLYGGKVKIPDSLMNRKSEMSEEQLRIYESAKIDLFESGKYGKFIIKDECIVEELEDDINGILSTNNNLKLVCIDYMGLISSKPTNKFERRKDPYLIITEGYEIVRNILRHANLAAVCINQFNDEGISAAYAGKPIRSGYIQGGHISNRHTDYDLSLTYTEEQKLAHVRMLSTSKTRGSAGFSNVILMTDLSVSLFRQEVVN